MTTKQTEALKLALEALIWEVGSEPSLYAANTRKAITAIREALAEQPAQQKEPVAVHQFRSPHCSDWYDGVPDHHDGHGPYEVRTLYTSPPASKPWVGLKEEEVSKLVSCTQWRSDESMHTYAVRACRAIEAKLREKNDG